MLFIFGVLYGLFSENKHLPKIFTSENKHLPHNPSKLTCFYSMWLFICKLVICITQSWDLQNKQLYGITLCDALFNYGNILKALGSFWINHVIILRHSLQWLQIWWRMMIYAMALCSLKRLAYNITVETRYNRQPINTIIVRIFV